MDFTHLLNQKAVYWAAPTRDGYHTPTFATPVEVSVRWEEKAELFVDSNGKEVQSKSIVFLDTDAVLDGYFYLGTLTSLSTAQKADPRTLSAAYPVRGYSKTADIHGLSYLRKVFL